MLESKTVVIQPRSQQLAQDQQHGDVEENRQEVRLVSSTVSEVTQASGPSGGQKDDQHNQADHEIGYAEPAPYAVIAPCFRGIRGSGPCARVCHKGRDYHLNLNTE